MTEFLVEWRIEVRADSPEAAARKCLEIMQDPSSLATVFDVIEENGEPVRIDLTEIDNEKEE